MILLKFLRSIFAANTLHHYTTKDLAGSLLDLKKIWELSRTLFTAWVCVLEFCHVKDIIMNDNPNVISLAVRRDIALRKYFGHGRLPSPLLVGQGIFPNAMICCASANLGTGTKNKYSLNTHSSAVQCLHTCVVGFYSVESFIVLRLVSRWLNPCSRFLIYR